MNATIEGAKAIQLHARSPLKETRVVDALEVGQWVRQGDVYIERVEIPADWKPTKNPQLAIGTTIGSRHTVDESVTVLANPANGQVQKLGKRAVCYGPQLTCKDRFTVSHPEHADISLPGGDYQVRFQVDAKSLQRVKD